MACIYVFSAQSCLGQVRVLGHAELQGHGDRGEAEYGRGDDAIADRLP